MQAPETAKMAPAKSRAQQLAEFGGKLAKDFDPEDDRYAKNTSDEEGGDDGAGTEHYAPVGKSKLRQKDTVALGPKYRGARVSRAALDESSEGDDDEDDDEAGDSGSEEYDDPETADLKADHVDEDFEIDSDEAFGSSDEEKFLGYSFRGSSKPSLKGKHMKRPVAADFMSGSEEGEGDVDDDEDDILDGLEGDDSDSNSYSNSDDGAGLSGEDDDDDDDENEDEDQDEELSEADGDIAVAPYVDQEMRKLAAAEASKPASNKRAMAKSATQVEEGLAIRQQQRTYDSLLKIRMQLQKALAAVNSFHVVDDAPQGEAAAYQAAEDAALKLWQTIDGFRDSLFPDTVPQDGLKRKRAMDSQASSQDVWNAMEEIESEASAYRNEILGYWSKKVSEPTVKKTRQLVAAPSHDLISHLENQMLNSERLVERSRVPRSCAPLQSARKVEKDADIYDDADFYQMLLKELIEQRRMDASAPGNTDPSVSFAAIKETKVRKEVDRKASKGRKMRFTVHEKIQNFMAPEDRKTWETEAIDRFFGTLFGRQMDLKDHEASDDEMGGVPLQEDGIRLFRN